MRSGQKRPPRIYELEGIVIGAAAFFIIGLLHPVVIQAELLHREGNLASFPACGLRLRDRIALDPLYGFFFDPCCPWIFAPLVHQGTF